MSALLLTQRVRDIVLCILVNAGVSVAGFRLSSPRGKGGYGEREENERIWRKTICTKERFAIERAAAGIIGNVICFAHDTRPKLGTDIKYIYFAL